MNETCMAQSATSEACAQCLARSWLLGRLGARLDHRTREPGLLWELLALDNEALIDAIGGRRRAEFHEDLRRFEEMRHFEEARCLEKRNRLEEPKASMSSATTTSEEHPRVHSVCQHQEDYPGALAIDAPSTPCPCVRVCGSLERANETLRGGVAIVGTDRASDYGMEVAMSLARQLTYAGVGVNVVFGEGIALAALRGSLEAGGAPLATMGGDVGRCSPSSCAGVYRRMSRGDGCLVSQLPPGTPRRRWSTLAAGRVIVLAASMTVVVELERDAPALAYVELARSEGKPVGAVPGRLTSLAASGANDLLRDGAILIRDVHDVLDALCRAGAAQRASASHPYPHLRPPMWSFDPEISTPTGSHGLRPSALAPSGPSPAARVTLEAIGAGSDTLAKLADAGMAQAATALALAELELCGLVVRGDGGRYLPSLQAGALVGGAAR